MNNTYLIKVKNIKEALDNIDSFEEKLQKMKRKNPEYKAKVALFKELGHWIIELNISNEDEN